MSFNVAHRISHQATLRPNEIAIATPRGSYRQRDHRTYETITFFDLDQRSSAIAAGLQQMGIKKGDRIVLLVRFGEDFITLVFALLKVGVVLVLIDPGMGRGNLIRCLESVNADGFVAIPSAQAIIKLLKHRFPNAKKNVTVGSRFGILPSPTLAQLERSSPADYRSIDTQLQDSAAVVFTTGSTGPPKGVLYTHQTFNSQVDQLVEHYSIAPGGKDLSAFPLFGLFNAVMGTTTIIPDMNPIRPADVDPPRLLDAIDQWQINQAFGSPALWTAVGRHCEKTKRRVSSLRLVLSAGAPVPARILRWVRDAMNEDGKMYTPYGATEALPIASIESRQVLGETAMKAEAGLGTCVGNRFSKIQWKIIKIDDGPLTSINQVEALPRGIVGELMVAGDVVSAQYVTRTDQNAIHKVQDGDRVWHRMGDVGYLDEQDRFWFCGRKSQRVPTSSGFVFTEPCEAILNTHPHVYRSALVGVSQSTDSASPNHKEIIDSQGWKSPVVVVEPWKEHRPRVGSAQESLLIQELTKLAQENEVTKPIAKVMIYPSKLPVDIRHNSKIFREKLVDWAQQEIRS